MYRRFRAVLTAESTCLDQVRLSLTNTVRNLKQETVSTICVLGLWVYSEILPLKKEGLPSQKFEFVFVPGQSSVFILRYRL